MRTETARHLPGDGSIWVFVLGEMLIFSCYFAAYMYDRGRNHDLFVASQRHLSLNIGFANTLILLASSLFVASSVQAAKAGNKRAASMFLALGAVCGMAFAILKSCEWVTKIRAGLTIGTNAFFMHYYMLTGIHFFHVALGLIILFILWQELHGKSPPRQWLMEVGATYWHMVDFLWIIIFALVYLMR
jgi:nitric oxide reductase NorE protein